MDIEKFKELPVLGILRGVQPDSIEPLVDAVLSAGLGTIEITMNTPDADKSIRRLVKVAEGKLMVGAGTVLTLEDMHLALNAGATYIVLPTLVKDVVSYCVKNNIPVFPGALTPQEIYNAWQSGATMVKVFPSKFFGPSYFKEIKGPFNNIELLACGGVDSENINEFFDCGASAVAFGASIFKKQWLEEKDFASISLSIKKLIEGYKQAVQS